MKKSSHQQKELQLKSWHCSFDTDEVHKLHEKKKSSASKKVKQEVQEERKVG